MHFKQIILGYQLKTTKSGNADSTYLSRTHTKHWHARQRAYLPHCFRESLNALKERLATTNKDLKSLAIKHEPNNDKEGRGAPDFVILSQGVSVGYIENKRVNADLDSVAQGPQIAKYLSLSDNLMLTDYLRFCLVRKDSKGKAQITQECRICDLSQIKTTLKDKAFLESKEQELKNSSKLSLPTTQNLLIPP